MGQGEIKRADVSAPFRALIFPFLELILITGLLWIAIGWCDVQAVDPMLRNGLVAVWALLGIWRFVIPLYKARRKHYRFDSAAGYSRCSKTTRRSVSSHPWLGPRHVFP